MGLEEIGKIILGLLTSIGGIGVVFTAIVKFSSDIIADKLSKKYELKLNKEMEAYKAGIESKTFISKTKFEAEFSMYRQLAKIFALMVKDVEMLFPRFTKDSRTDIEKYKKEHDNAVDSIVAAQDELYACAPFITKELYDKFFEMETLCKQQLSDFQDFRLRPDAEDYRKELSKEYREAYSRTTEIDAKFNELIENIREYLSTLDVIE